MKIESQVCSLHQSKKLQQLGVLQNSAWYYTWYNNSDRYYINSKNTANDFYRYSLKKYGDESVSEISSAFNVAELLCMHNEDIFVKTDQINSLATILADLLINKIENELVTVEVINENISAEFNI